MGQSFWVPMCQSIATTELAKCQIDGSKSWTPPSSISKSWSHPGDPGLRGLSNWGSISPWHLTCTEQLSSAHQVQLLWEPNLLACPEGPTTPYCQVEKAKDGVELYPVPQESYDNSGTLHMQLTREHCDELMDILKAIRESGKVVFGTKRCWDCDDR